MDTELRRIVASFFKQVEGYKKGENEFVPVEVVKRTGKVLKKVEKGFNKIFSELEDVTEKLRLKEEELRSMTGTAEKLKSDLDNRKVHFGRNQVRKHSMDAFSRANLSIIGKFVDKIFRHHKILDPSWSVYLPDVAGSFFKRIIDLLDIDEEMPVDHYWHQYIVPMINSKLCDKRSDATKNIQKGYLGKGDSMCDVLLTLPSNNDLFYFTTK